MTTPSGPKCHRCHTPFNGQPCYIGFFFVHLRYCSKACLDAAAEERQKQRLAEEYRMEKHGRRWRVLDGNGELVVVAYKKGASEVMRRLSRSSRRSFRTEADIDAVNKSR